MDKVRAEYVDRPIDGQQCFDCTMFRVPNNCTLVEGFINTYGWCKFFKRKEKASGFYRNSISLLKNSVSFVDCHDFREFTEATRVTDVDPTQFQIITENYRKAHTRIDGLPIVIETPQHVIRRKRNPDGSIIWARDMPYAYGYINGTMDADFDPVDVFVGDYPGTKIVYIMDQQHHEHKTFDEHKVFIWFRDKRHAKHCYYDSFDKKKEGKKRLMSMVGMHITDFKEWLKTNGTMHPISRQDLHDII